MKMQLAKLLRFTILLATAFVLIGAIPNPAAARQHGRSCWWRCGGQSDNAYRHSRFTPVGNAAPEIDPGTAMLAVGLVAGGLAILRDRRRR